MSRYCCPRKRFLFSLFLLTVVCLGPVRANMAGGYPQASLAESGISADAIELLDEYLERLVQSEDVVGAEFHLIKERKTVFHESYGWADVEEQRPLQKDSLYCVRSMTKPLVGTAVQMLLDEGRLTLDQRVVEILPEFDRPRLREITIEHLLTHTSGLPLTAIRRPLTEYASLREVAEDAVEAGVSFEPGTRFQYSDAGSDTLGAVVAAVSGMGADKFVESRILQPLGMSDTHTLIRGGADYLSRIPSAYSGGKQNWQRHWQPADAPMFPVFLTSQSLYCTTTDYARFLAMWTDRGHSESGRLISEVAVKRALKPGRKFRYPTGFPNLTATYGQQWVLYHSADEEQPTVFGHSGSDGTHAWVWPQRDLMAFFFTQSRGTLAGIELESVLDRLLIKGELESVRKELRAPDVANHPLQRYEGIYWDQDVEAAYYVVKAGKDALLIERPGRFRMLANPQATEGRFSMGAGTVTLEFTEQGGTADAMLLTSRERTERQERHAPDPQLPNLEEVIATVQRAHATSSLAGVVKLNGTLTVKKQGREGKVQQWIGDRRARTEIKFGPITATVVINGEHAAASPMGGPIKRIDGVAMRQAVLGHPVTHYGGWREGGYTDLQLLKQVSVGGQECWLIRAMADELPDATFVVDRSTGRIVGQQRLEFLPGAGFVGVQEKYSDFRQVQGMTIPFHIVTRLAHPAIGEMVTRYESFEINDVSSEMFELPAE